MRKAIAMLCVAVMLMVMTAPAFANPSIVITVIPETEGVIIIPLDEEDPAKGIEEKPIRDVIEAVNGEGFMDPAEAVTTLLGKESEDLAGKLEEVNGYSFTSRFFRIYAPDFPVDVIFEGTEESTRIMLIKPDADPKEKNNVVILKRNADRSFTFPFAGLFALMDPTPTETSQP